MRGHEAHLGAGESQSAGVEVLDGLLPQPLLQSAETELFALPVRHVLGPHGAGILAVAAATTARHGCRWGAEGNVAISGRAGVGKRGEGCWEMRGISR